MLCRHIWKAWGCPVSSTTRSPSIARPPMRSTPWWICRCRCSWPAKCSVCRSIRGWQRSGSTGPSRPVTPSSREEAGSSFAWPNRARAFFDAPRESPPEGGSRLQDGLEPAMSLQHCKLIDLPIVEDRRGNLTFIEGGQHIPFDIKRVYYLYD